MNAKNVVKISYMYGYTGNRPIVELWSGIKVLIDTGADRNIWYGRDVILNKIETFHVDWIVEVGNITNRKLKTKPHFIRFNLNGFNFENLHVLVPLEKSEPRLYDMILGVDSLEDMEITINFKEKFITICSDHIQQTDKIFSSIKGGAGINEAFGFYESGFA